MEDSNEYIHIIHSSHSSVASATDKKLPVSTSLNSLRRPANSASSPQLSIQVAGGTAQRPKNTERLTSDFEDTASLFAYLGRSMSKIEKDLLDRKDIPHYVMESLADLKRLIENSPYCEAGMAAKKKSSSSFFTKISKLRIKGLFSSG